MSDLKPFLEDMLSMSTGTDGRTLQIHFCRPVTMADRQAMAAAHNAIVRGEITQPPAVEVRGSEAAIRKAGQIAIDELIDRWSGSLVMSNDDMADYMTRIVDACVRAALSAPPVEHMSGGSDA